MDLLSAKRKASAVSFAFATLIAAACSIASLAHAAQEDLAKQQALYREKLAEYTNARAAYEEVAGPYWKSITEKRSRRGGRDTRSRASPQAITC